MISSVLGSNPFLVLWKAKTLLPKVPWHKLWFIVFFFYFFKKKPAEHTLQNTQRSSAFIFESSGGFLQLQHFLWLCLKQQEEREIILFGLYHISLKIAPLQQVCEWVLTVFDQCSACQNSGGLMGKCVQFWCRSVSEVYLKGGGMVKGEEWTWIILPTKLQCYTRHVSWNWDESAGLFHHAVPFCQHNKAKGNGSDYSITDMRTEMLLSCNQFQRAFLHLHAVIWLSVPLYPHSIFSHSPDCVMTDLQAHAPCKYKQLATTLNPYIVLWQWMDMFNQYNPLSWDGHRLLQG